ncbi:MAG: hypothetical protein EPN37_16970 [Chitinophagaceae bacterium]|nr:MAG: hypothetical protein EPN37_16970 [Chitinophagaceae bacterium]
MVYKDNENKLHRASICPGNLYGIVRINPGVPVVDFWPITNDDYTDNPYCISKSTELGHCLLCQKSIVTHDYLAPFNKALNIWNKTITGYKDKYKNIVVDHCSYPWTVYDVSQNNDQMYRQLALINLADKKLLNLAKGLGSAYVRVSGTRANGIYFQDNDEPKMAKAPAGFVNVLTRKEWKGVVNFIKATHSKLVTSFAACMACNTSRNFSSPFINSFTALLPVKGLVVSFSNVLVSSILLLTAASFSL